MSTFQPWLMPLMGSLAQQNAAAATPPPPPGASFLIIGHTQAPLGTDEHIRLGESGDNRAGFIMPFATTLVASTVRIIRQNGLRQNLDVSIRINGVKTVLSSLAASARGAFSYTHSISLSGGDKVELIYTCGNNFGLGVGYAFQFERAGETSKGPFWLRKFSSWLDTYDRVFRTGENGYVVFPAAPAPMKIRRLTYHGSIPALADQVLSLRVDGIRKWSGVHPLGATSFEKKVEVSVPANSPFGFYCDANAASSGSAEVVLECEMAEGADAPNSSMLFFQSTSIQNAGNFGMTDTVAPAAGKISYVSAGTEFSHVGVTLSVSINGGADIALYTYTANNAIVGQSVNVTFAAGDRLRFKHDGSGVTGSGVMVSFVMEFDNLDDYAPIVYSVNGTPLTWTQDSIMASSSNYPHKGNIVQCWGDRMLTKIKGDFSLAGQSVNVVITEVDSGDRVTEVLLDGENFTSILGETEITLATPIFLQAGCRFTFGFSRQEAGGLRIQSDDTPNADANGHFILSGDIVRNSATSPAVGNDLTFSSASSWAVGVTTEDVVESAGAVPPAPSNTVAPVISGAAAIPATLTATDGTWDGAPTTFRYQWKSGLTNVGSNQNTYDTVIGDDTNNITCEVTALNAEGSATATSNAIAVTNTLAAPVNTVLPVISGSLNLPSTLTCTSVGTWTGEPTPTFDYQWKVNGSNDGFNQDTFDAEATEDGKDVTCVITATNSEGVVTAVSNALSMVAPAAGSIPVLTYTSDVVGGTFDNLDFNYPVGIAAGDLLMILAASDDPSGANRFDTPAGWTLHSSHGSGLTDNVVNVYSKVAAGTETGAFSLVYNGTSTRDRAGFLIRLTAASADVDMGIVGTPLLTTTASDMVIPAITTLQAESLILAVIGFDGSDFDPFGYPAGYTMVDEIGVGGAGGVGLSFATRDLSVAGSTGTCTVTQTLTDGATGILVSVNPAP